MDQSQGNKEDETKFRITGDDSTKEWFGSKFTLQCLAKGNSLMKLRSSQQMRGTLTKL